VWKTALVKECGFLMVMAPDLNPGTTKIPNLFFHGPWSRV
jgi:hypothetical protein